MTEALLLRRSFVAQRAWNQPGHRINNQRGANLAAAQNKITDRDFAIREVIIHSLINAFVASADQYHAFKLRQLLRGLLIEALARRRQQHDGFTFAIALVFRSNAQRFYTFEQRLRLEHHAFAAAKWTVIYRLVAVTGKRAQIVQREFNQPSLARAAHDPIIQRTTEEVREYGDNLKLHPAASD